MAEQKNPEHGEASKSGGTTEAEDEKRENGAGNGKAEDGKPEDGKPEDGAAAKAEGATGEAAPQKDGQASSDGGKGTGKAAAAGAAAGAVAGRKGGRKRETSGRRGGGEAMRGVLSLIARIVMLIASLIAAFIVLGILLKVLGANRVNPIVSAVISGGEQLVGPLGSIFKSGTRNVQVVINWGIAAIVYLAVGAIIAKILRR